MRAIQFDHYGPPSVLSCRECPRPAAAPDRIVVQVHAAAVNPKDCLVRKGHFRLFTGRRFPKGLGHDFAGEVVTVGPRVQGFKPGDCVFGMTNGWQGRTYAEYVQVDPSETALKPEGLAYEQAAALPLAAQTALQALRDIGRVRPGDRVCINGASGGVGTLAIQIACILGARVTAVCSHRNVEMVKSLGAETVWDYTVQDIREAPGSFDVFFDVFGNRHFTEIRSLLKSGGAYISTVPGLRIIRHRLLTPFRATRHARLVIVTSRDRDLQQLADWTVRERLHPVIDRTFALAEAADAHALIETRRARGKVVLRVT